MVQEVNLEQMANQKDGRRYKKGESVTSPHFTHKESRRIKIVLLYHLP
jgi:hypothetical protein